MLKVVELLMKVAKNGQRTVSATMCLGTGMVKTPISTVLNLLVDDLETSDEETYEQLVDALLWGGDTRRLGAIVDDATWCEALGDAVCDLDVETSAGDWCLGLIISADTLLSNLDDAEVDKAASEALITAIAAQCKQIMSDDAAAHEPSAQTT